VSEDGGGALGDVKEAFSGKRGKVLLIGGAAAIVGYVWWTRRNGGVDVPEEPADVVADGPSGRTPQTDPEVGNTNTGDGGTTGRKKYTNNGEWLADATDFLVGRAVPAGSAYDALNKALSGGSLTTQQISWVSQAIAALGAPPEGMPPLNASAPPSTPSRPKPTPTGWRGYGWYRANGKESGTQIAKKYKITTAQLFLYNPSAPFRPKAGTWLKVRANSNPLTGYKGK
jgi:hypothetical protein